MRLWDKGDSLNEKIHAFTVGNEFITDLNLVPWDIIGSAAHARVLANAGFISTQELEQLISALRKLQEIHEAGKFTISPAQEDCHTAIEEFLIAKLGEVGRKIHTGRSRNDQVMVAMRLLLRHEATQVMSALLKLGTAFMERMDSVGDVPMPGHTHLQLAMPSSVAMWLHAFLEESLELMLSGETLLQNLDSNPSEVGSGFGIPLTIDRELSTKLLGFNRVQRNPINVISSRGHQELLVTRWLSDIASLVERFAWDMVLFCTREFGYFKLPNEFTTGSSIMPQKRNPDVVELLRGRAARVRALEFELVLLGAKLPSNYHREFQYSKEPCIAAISEVKTLLAITPEIARSFTFDEERLRDSMGAELYVTYDVYRAVRGGTAFRDAYLATAKRFANGEVTTDDLSVDFEVVNARNVKERAAARAELAAFDKRVQKQSERMAAVKQGLMGPVV